MKKQYFFLFLLIGLVSLHARKAKQEDVLVIKTNKVTAGFLSGYEAKKIKIIPTTKDPLYLEQCCFNGCQAKEINLSKCNIKNLPPLLFRWMPELKPCRSFP